MISSIRQKISSVGYGFRKHKNLLAWLILLSIVFSLGVPVWSDEPYDDPPPEEEPADEIVTSDMPNRTDEMMLAQAEMYTSTPNLELWVLDKYTYYGYETSRVDVFAYDADNMLIVLKESDFSETWVRDSAGNAITFDNADDARAMLARDNLPAFFDAYGQQLDTSDRSLFRAHRPRINGELTHSIVFFPVRIKYSGDTPVFSKEGEEKGTLNISGLTASARKEITAADRSAYSIPVTEGERDIKLVRGMEDSRIEVPKTKEDAMFGVRVKSTGHIWWSTPPNMVNDRHAFGEQKDRLSSQISFRAANGNHINFSSFTAHSNFGEDRSQPGQPANFFFINACTRIEKIDGGARFHYEFIMTSDATVRIVMDVVLQEGKNGEKDSVLVTIPVNKIEETQPNGDSGRVLLSLSLLNSFGAAREGDNGYIVVPDGSGAIIEFDNNKTDAAQYFGQVYGRDLAVSHSLAPPVNQQVYLPVFGIVHQNGDSGDNALVAIAEKGAENAIVRAAVSRQGANRTEYNLAWFDFNLRSTDNFRIGTANREVSIYESEFIKTGDLSVRYYPIYDENLSYVEVAMTYRKYLQEHKGVKSRITENAPTPFYMTLNGGTVKRHSIAGFPINLQTSATTYSQAGKIINDMKDADIHNLVVLYNDFNTAKIKRQISTSVQYSGLLGGKSGFRDLTRIVDDNNIVLYPSIGFMEYHESGGGYSFLLHSSKEVTRSVARQSRYELAFGTPDQFASSYTILSPYHFSGAMDKIIRSFNKEGISHISLDNATTLLYSDFSRRNPFGTIYFNRRDTAQILTEGFEKINDAGISIMAQAANAYALPYVSHIANVPMSSSNYDMFDYDVPFYQIVIQGLIPYSTTPFNANSDLNALTLLALSAGAPVHYEFIYTNAGEFNDSDYNSKFYASYDGWGAEAVKMYKMFDEIIGDVINVPIVKHRRIIENEVQTAFETEFANGKTVYINLSTYELRVNGQRVDLSKYNIGGIR
jgi:hypothetical protein